MHFKHNDTAHIVFLGPRGPLRVPMPVHPPVHPSTRPSTRGVFIISVIFTQWFHYKSLHHHVRPIKSYIFWKLMIPTIHWRTEMTKTMTKSHIHKYTNVKSLKDPSCAIFLKSMGVKDIKYDIPMWHGGHGHDGQRQLVQATTTGSDMPSALGLVDICSGFFSTHSLFHKVQTVFVWFDIIH